MPDCSKVTEYESEITCPRCGHRKKEIMPSDACVYFYECENCKSVLKPLRGDCCVFCSYGTVKCPPVQADTGCCKRIKLNKENVIFKKQKTFSIKLNLKRKYLALLI